MNWYYAVAQERHGPVPQEELERLVRSGTVTRETLVWREGMPDWQPYGTLGAAPGSTGIICAACGQAFSFEQMQRVGDAYVCPGCQPAYVAGMNHLAGSHPTVVYAGFWVRFAAMFVDSIILSLLMVPMIWVSGIPVDTSSLEAFQETLARLQLMAFLLTASYQTFFVGLYAASPGKMLLRLKIIRADGSPVGYLRALCRCLSQTLSQIILYIGYLMAAIDREEHKALHDLICDTRVIRS